MGKRQKQAASDGWSRWYLVPEKDRRGRLIQRIKRYRKLDGKTVWERLEAKTYRGMDEEQLQGLLRRLNVTYIVDKERLEALYDFNHAYINTVSKEKFRDELKKESREAGHQGDVMSRLDKYVFQYFILMRKTPDPSRWHLLQNDWGKWLLEQNLSPAILRKIVATANRFNKFLVEFVYPEMPVPRKLNPIGETQLALVEKQRAKSGEKIRTKYITQETWNKILNSKDPKVIEVLPNMKLCYAFGLRISETLGLTKEKFRRDYLLVDEQGERLTIIGDEKSIKRKEVKTDSRKVPYWNMTAQEAWGLVKQIKVMHPNTLGARVNACLGAHGHTSHDFRRTFITNSFRSAPHWKDVMRAAGHKDVRTTLSYDQDDRAHGNEAADLED